MSELQLRIKKANVSIGFSVDHLAVLQSILNAILLMPLIYWFGVQTSDGLPIIVL